MPSKNTRARRDIKKLFSSVLCFLISLMFIGSIFIYGFSIAKLVFGAMTLYFSIAFFRMSKE